MNENELRQKIDDAENGLTRDNIDLLLAIIYRAITAEMLTPTDVGGWHLHHLQELERKFRRVQQMFSDNGGEK